MALRTDYQDAMFDGKRKYRLIENDDSTVSLADATTYTQEGDRFGANDINETNTEVNRVADELGNKAPAGHTHDASDIQGILPVGKGGTGASDRVNAFYNLAFIGSQPIASTNDDTIENWFSKGSGFCVYGTNGLLIDQPSQYGFLINYAYGGGDVGQIWITRPNGVMYVRGGNKNGWSGTWKKLFDDSNVIPVSNGGTGATSFTSGQLLIGNGANAVTGRGVTDNTSMKTCSGTYIPTCNTVAQHAAAVLNRSNGVHNANTAYTTYMARGIALVTSAPSSLANGCCAFVYQ